MTAVVYRIHDRSGRLLYVGATTNLERRLEQHRTQSWWYALLHRVEEDPRESMSAALAAEAAAIRSERPAFNVAHAGGRRRRLNSGDLRVCREWADGQEWRIAKLPPSLRWIAEPSDFQFAPRSRRRAS